MEIKDLQYKLSKEFKEYRVGNGRWGEPREIRVEPDNDFGYIIKAYFKEEDIMYYVPIEKSNAFMYKKMKRYWNIEKEQLIALFDKYNFHRYMYKAVAEKVKEELEALAMMGKLVTE